MKILLLEKSINDHYINRYFGLIARKDDESYDGELYHRHHILPKSMYPEFEKEKWNIIKISPRLHFILHWCLHYAVSGRMTAAYYQMCIDPRNGIRISSRVYERAITSFSNQMRRRNFFLVGESLRRLLPEDPLVTSGEAILIEKFSEIPNWKDPKEGKEAPHHKGKCVVYDSILKKNRQISVADIDYETLIPIGKLRCRESRRKTSRALRDRFHCYDPVGGKRRFLKIGDTLPEGWRSGVPPEISTLASDRFLGSRHYHNPTSGEMARFKDGKAPDGWILGRPYANNIFSGSVPYVCAKTGESILLGVEECPPRYSCPPSAKYFYSFEGQGIKVFSYQREAILVSVPKETRATKYGLLTRDFDDPFEKRKFKGKSLSDLGYGKVPIDEWDFSKDGEWEWTWIRPESRR